ncbi:hypothetical protein FA95DRAFT_1141100 [Auriscalpium vulgare]|uniref:Uncharacterized protein n=1 Tax=Auriscalpium vulgare TaxID=40419 RepID=A0ACB8RW16_9AGAM|nr:hypothetical protein FA95DRAFT_1141100 [Auriscalpium vulgare]
MGRRGKKQEVFVVEVITAARVTEDNDWEYYVKWEGYDSDADTWEPEANVAKCKRLLHSFWEHVGTDNEDYPVGYTCEAKDYWIALCPRVWVPEAAQRKGQEEELWLCCVCIGCQKGQAGKRERRRYQEVCKERKPVGI